MGTALWVCGFDPGNGRDKMLLGGKRANLCEMTQVGINLPPGRVATIESCLACLGGPKRRLPKGLRASNSGIK